MTEQNQTEQKSCIFLLRLILLRHEWFTMISWFCKQRLAKSPYEIRSFNDPRTGAGGFFQGTYTKRGRSFRTLRLGQEYPRRLCWNSCSRWRRIPRILCGLVSQGTSIRECHKGRYIMGWNFRDTAWFSYTVLKLQVWQNYKERCINAE